MKYIKPKVKLLSHTLNPELVIACAGKLCYSSVGVDDLLEKQTDESISRFVNMLVDIGHESPIEHASFTFAIEGISRACSHQLVRHRIASYSQQSQRYVKLAQFSYIVPPQIDKDAIASAIYVKAMEDAQKAYNNIYDRLLVTKAQEYGVHSKYTRYVQDELFESFKALRILETYNLGQNPEAITNEGLMSLEEFWKQHDKGLPEKDRLFNKTQKQLIEDARYVFPNACETKLVVTMNARTLVNFFNHRSCDRAQWEIKELSDIMIELVKEVAPILFSKAGPNCVSGPCPEGKMSCGKVKEMRTKYTNK